MDSAQQGQFFTHPIVSTFDRVPFQLTDEHFLRQSPPVTVSASGPVVAFVRTVVGAAGA
jgi:hypothetical protein